MPWRFLLFTSAVGLLVYLHFYLAHRQWRRLKGEPSTEIDPSYIRVENYFSQSFRAKVKEWLALPGEWHEESKETRIIKGKERIRVTGPLALDDGETCTDILVVKGEFSCGRGCRLASEILVRGHARLGRDSQAQAITADGRLVLEDSVRLARWADCMGEMVVSAGSRIGARATSRTAIRMGAGTRAGSLYAPAVTTADWNGTLAAAEPPAEERLVLPLPADVEEPPAALSQAGMDPARLHRLSPDTWLYNGDWMATLPVLARSKLVVKGDCRIARNSILERDVKAGHSLHLEEGTVARASLVAGRNLVLDARCRFSGVLHAGHSILLRRGVRGIAADLPVAAYAVETLHAENDVAVQGKLSGGSGVEVLSAGAPEPLRERMEVRKEVRA
jgi:hypothetical protein